MQLSILNFIIWYGYRYDNCHTKSVTAKFANRHLSSWTQANVESFHLEMLESSIMLILIQKSDRVCSDLCFIKINLKCVFIC